MLWEQVGRKLLFSPCTHLPLLNLMPYICISYPKNTRQAMKGVDKSLRNGTDIVVCVVLGYREKHKIQFHFVFNSSLLGIYFYSCIFQLFSVPLETPTLFFFWLFKYVTFGNMHTV